MESELQKIAFIAAEGQGARQWSWSDSRLLALRRIAGAALPVLSVILTVFTILHYFGVNISQTMLYAAYEIGFIGIPGMLVYAASNNSDRWLQRIAVGWALGYVIELGAFIITGIFDIREWFTVYPLIVIAVALPFVIRTRRSLHHSDGTAHHSRTIRNWGLAVASFLAIAYVSISSFAVNPLPGSVAQVDYYVDLSWAISNAAEARHHWPITDPRVSGEPFPYHTFVYMHLAAISNTTGLDLSVVFFRLYLTVFFLLIVVQLYVLGAGSTDRWKLGLLTVMLFLFFGEIDPFRTMQFPFFGVAVADLTLSPTYLFGLVLFLPLIGELNKKLGQPATAASSWIPVGILLFGATGAKGAAPSVLLGGLGLFTLYIWWRERSINLAAIRATALVIVMLGVFWLILFRGYPSPMRFDPLATFRAMEVSRQLSLYLGKYGCDILLSIGPGLLGIMGMTAVGLTGLFWRRGERIPLELLLYLCLLVPGLQALYLLNLDGASQMYFYDFSYAAAVVPAAHGIYRIVALLKRTRLAVKLAVGIPLLLIATVCALDLPLDNRKVIHALRAGLPTHLPVNGLTPNLYHGLLWVRDHTPVNAVLAVNWYYLPPEQNDPRYFYFSAFSERRVFLEGWAYTNESRRIGYVDVMAGRKHPFPERLALNSAVFECADSNALKIMVSRYGVTHLVVDKLHAGNAGYLSAVAKRVYSNPDIDIYEVPAAIAHLSLRSCLFTGNAGCNEHSQTASQR